MALVDLSLANSEAVQGTNNHESVGITVKNGSREHYTVVHVALVVKDCSSTGAAANQVNLISSTELLVEKSDVDLLPRILVTTDDDRWAVCVEEENSGILRGLRQQKVLEGDRKSVV